MDQVQDTANAQFLLDLMQHFAVPVCWFLSWVALLLAQVATWMTDVVASFAQHFWLTRLLREVAVPIYLLAIVGALILLALTYLVTSTGIRVRWVRTSATIRWTIIMIILVNVGIPLYANLERGVDQFPSLFVTTIGIPTFTLGSVHPTVDGTTYAPFDPSSGHAVAERGSPLAPITPRGETGQVTAFDLTLALWHATPDEVFADAPGVTVPTDAGSLPIDTMPAQFATAFFPDPATATGGSGDGAAQRRLLLARGRAGSVQAVVGLLASMATLLPALTTLLLVFGTLFTVGLAVLVAPLGLFGTWSLWVGRMIKQWGAFVLWRVAVRIVILIIERLCFGTAAMTGIAVAWPLTPVVLLLIIAVEWKLFKLAWRIVGHGLTPLRQAAASFTGAPPTATAAMDTAAVTIHHTTDGITPLTDRAIGAGAQGAWSMATIPSPVAHGGIGGAVHGGMGLFSLVDADMRAAQRDQPRAHAPVAPSPAAFRRPASPDGGGVTVAPTGSPTGAFGGTAVSAPMEPRAGTGDGHGRNATPVVAPPMPAGGGAVSSDAERTASPRAIQPSPSAVNPAPPQPSVSMAHPAAPTALPYTVIESAAPTTPHAPVFPAPTHDGAVPPTSAMLPQRGVVGRGMPPTPTAPPNSLHEGKDIL